MRAKVVESTTLTDGAKRCLRHDWDKRAERSIRHSRLDEFKVPGYNQKHDGA